MDADGKVGRKADLSVLSAPNSETNFSETIWSRYETNASLYRIDLSDIVWLVSAAEAWQVLWFTRGAETGGIMFGARSSFTEKRDEVDTNFVTVDGGSCSQQVVDYGVATRTPMKILAEVVT